MRARWSCSQRQGPASAGVGQGPVGPASKATARGGAARETGWSSARAANCKCKCRARSPRDVSARARPPRLIEPSGQRLRWALPAAAGTHAPLVVVKWPREVARVTQFQARMDWRSACCVSCSGAAQGGSRSGTWSSLPWTTRAGGWRARPSAGPSQAAQVPLQGCRHLQIIYSLLIIKEVPRQREKSRHYWKTFARHK